MAPQWDTLFNKIWTKMYPNSGQITVFRQKYIFYQELIKLFNIYCVTDANSFGKMQFKKVNVTSGYNTSMEVSVSYYRYI